MLAVCGACFFGGIQAGAATITWADVGTDFATGANWVGGVAPANSTATDIASFGLVTTNQPILAAIRSINGLAFTAGSTNAVTLTGAVFTIGASGINNQSTGGLKTISNNLTLAANQSFTNNGAMTIAGTVANGGRALTLTGTGASGTLSGILSGTGGLNKLGTGTWVVSGANTYTGRTVISAGTLSVNSLANLSTASALGAPTTNNMGTIRIGTGATGATLRYTGSGSTTNRVINLAGTTGGATLDSSGTGALNLTSNITATGAGSKTLTLTGSNTNANTISGTIVNNSGANTTSLVKSGAGTWTLSGASANTYTGTTAINDGTLNLNKTAGVNALGTGAGAVTIGDSSGAASSANLVLQASNQIANGTAITINSDGRLSLDTFSEAINTVAGSGLIDLGASGALTVNASSTFSGKLIGSGSLTIAGGTFTLGSSLGITPDDFAGTLNLSAGTTLALNGFNFTMGTLHITGNSILDFGNSSASILNATNLIIDTGATLTINNWVDVTDYFYVTNNPGATALGQITFSGYAGPARWQTYDQQVTPVPEPATYGAVLTGFAALLLAWRRRQAVRA